MDYSMMKKRRPMHGLKAMAEGGEVEGGMAGEGQDMDQGQDMGPSEMAEFTMPPQLMKQIPQGQTKDVMCTIRNIGMGKGSVEAVDGIPLGEDQGPPMEQEEPEEDGGTEGRMASFFGGQGPKVSQP